VGADVDNPIMSYLTGIDLHGAKSDNPTLREMIRKQEAPEKYWLLSEVAFQKPFFEKDILPLIGRNLL